MHLFVLSLTGQTGIGSTARGAVGFPVTHVKWQVAWDMRAVNERERARLAARGSELFDGELSTQASRRASVGLLQLAV